MGWKKAEDSRGRNNEKERKGELYERIGKGWSKAEESNALTIDNILGVE